MTTKQPTKVHPNFYKYQDIEKLPVLPDLKQMTDLDIAVSENGEAYLIYDKDFAEVPEYVLYDRETKKLHLVSLIGRTQSFGIKVRPEIGEYLDKSEKIHVIQMEDGKPVKVSSVLIIFQLY